MCFLTVQNTHRRAFSFIDNRELACVASVFVGFGSKERPRNGIFGVLSARKMGREPKKKKEGGGRGEGRKRLQTNPWILKTSVRQRTGLAIGWASPISLTSVDQRYFNTFECQTKGEDAFEACSQNALTFPPERGFSRQLRQYGRNPVVQCRRFGFFEACISKRDTICSCSFNFNITFLNATCAKDKIINRGTEDSHYCVGKPSDFVWPRERLSLFRHWSRLSLFSLLDV